MEIPVARLTEQDLSDIPGFISSHRSELAALGMVKLVAPRRLTAVPEDFDMTIHAPIMQAVTGTGGVYKLNLVDIEPQSARLFGMFARQEQPTGAGFDELEEKFWRGLSARRKMEAPVYGADVPGSLFDACNASVSFQGGVNSLLRFLKKDIPGVTSPMLYFGTFGSMFGIHKEDMDLYSINYLHEGAPKQWYLIPPSQAHQVESVCHLEYPMDAQECSEFIRHKNCMLSPKLLQGYGLHLYTTRQEPGEFIVTFPRCYHFGFNFGANIAESVNFATPDWLDVGRRAKYCTCSTSNVKIDVDALEHAWRQATGDITPTIAAPSPKGSRLSPATVGRSIQSRFTTQRARGHKVVQSEPGPQSSDDTERKINCDSPQHALLAADVKDVAADARGATAAIPKKRKLVTKADTIQTSTTKLSKSEPLPADSATKQVAATKPSKKQQSPPTTSLVSPASAQTKSAAASSAEVSEPQTEKPMTTAIAPAPPSPVDLSAARNRKRTNKLMPQRQIEIFLPDTQQWSPCVVLEKGPGSTKALVQFPNGLCDYIDENQVTFRQRYT